MSLPGDKLLDLCSRAEHEVILISPFIKATTLERILRVIPENIRAIKCITRWRPEEVAAGVSDLEILDEIYNRGGKLFIHPLLHAKYFRVDENCLVGSANLTQRGLGWAHSSNLELLVNMHSNHGELVAFEKTVCDEAFEATTQLRDEILNAVKLLEKETIRILGEEIDPINKQDENINNWIPLCTRPERLFQIYSNDNISQLIEWTLEAGKKDLEFLNIPPGLSRDNFYQYVAITFQNSTLLNKILGKSDSPIGSDEGENIVNELMKGKEMKYSPSEHWAIIKDWLLHFLPHIFRQPSGSDDIQKGMTIGEFK